MSEGKKSRFNKKEADWLKTATGQAINTIKAQSQSNPKTQLEMLGSMDVGKALTEQQEGFLIATIRLSLGDAKARKAIAEVHAIKEEKGGKHTKRAEDADKDIKLLKGIMAKLK